MANKKKNDEEKNKKNSVSKSTSKKKTSSSKTNKIKKDSVKEEKVVSEKDDKKNKVVDDKDAKKKQKELEKELKKERKKIYSVGGMNPDVKSKIIIVVVIIIVFVAFYFLTVLINNKSTSSSSSSSSKSSSTSSSISYDEIVIGRSFSMSDGEYLVLYYDESNTDLSSNLSSVVSTYKSKESHLPVYIVNMNSPFNSSYESDDSNTNPSSVEEMKINGPTLIKFNNGKVEDYIEGEEEISNYLN